MPQSAQRRSCSVVSPAWRLLNKEFQQARNKVGHLRRKRALQTDAQGASALELDEQIAACEQQVEGLALAR